MSREHKKIERLFLFSEVADQLSFTQAANTLGISKGYLSAQIKQLEQELATPLLVRSTRAVRLTKAGEDIVHELSLVRKSLVNIERGVRSGQTEMIGQLNITAPKQFAQSVLADICYHFCQQYPKINIAIDSSYTPHDLTASDFDIAFRATTNPPQNMIAKKLIDYHYICCASPEYISQHDDILPTDELSKLQGHQCLTKLGQAHWQFKQDQVAINGWLSVNDHLLLKHEALKGRGIIQVPDYVVADELAAGSLVEVFSSQRAKGQTIYILQPQLINPPIKVSTFIQFVHNFLLK